MYESCVSCFRYPHIHRANFFFLIAIVSDAHMQLSLSCTHTHTRRRTHKHHSIFQIRLFHGSFPPSSPLKMTVADISTHSEGKRADISSWVTKLGSNYIALSRQPWLLLTRPDIWSVSAGYQFCLLPSIQHLADSLCYVFWMRRWTARYYFPGRMFFFEKTLVRFTLLLRSQVRMSWTVDYRSAKQSVLFCVCQGIDLY